MEIGEGTSLKQLIQSMCPESANVIEGIVTSASPLKITLANDSKMVLGSSSLIVPKHLTNYLVTVDITKESQSTNLEGATLTVYNALKKGETVYLLAFNGGKRFYILDRKG